MKKIGEITHYFTNIQVAVFNLTDSNLSVGDRIHLKGATTDFTQTVNELQIDKEKVQTAEKGQQVGVKIEKRVREGDEVFLAGAED